MSDKGHRFPPEFISHAIRLYHRFTLSFRDVEDLLAERGIIVSYEAIRYCCIKYGSTHALPKLLTDKVREQLNAHLQEVRASSKYSQDDIEAGRRYVNPMWTLSITWNSFTKQSRIRWKVISTKERPQASIKGKL